MTGQPLDHYGFPDGGLETVPLLVFPVPYHDPQQALSLTPDDTYAASPFRQPENTLLPELANLVQELRNQMPPAGPSCRVADGTSAARPFEFSSAAHETDDDVDELHQRLPSAWYQTPPAKQQSGPLPVLAMVAGLAAGLFIGVPVALWQSASVAPAPLSDTDRAQIARDLVLEATAHAGRHAASPGLDQARIDILATRVLSRPVYEPTIDEAKRLIGQGNVVAARDTLLTAAAAKSPKALFAMAETFDPNRLAAWGTRGVAADPDRAKELYEAALGLGHDAAQARLSALK